MAIKKILKTLLLVAAFMYVVACPSSQDLIPHSLCSLTCSSSVWQQYQRTAPLYFGAGLLETVCACFFQKPGPVTAGSVQSAEPSRILIFLSPIVMLL